MSDRHLEAAAEAAISFSMVDFDACVPARKAKPLSAAIVTAYLDSLLGESPTEEALKPVPRHITIQALRVSLASGQGGGPDDV